MIAVAQIGGHQAIVKVGEQLEVDKIDAEVGSKVEFDVLLISEEDGSDFSLGTPFLEGTKVEAKVVEHSRGKKVRVFKMKPRKRYRREKGHRQDYTVVEIVKIGAGAKKAVSKTTEKEEKSDTESTEQTPKKTTKAVSKKPTTKSSTPTKTTSTKKVEKKEEGK